MWCARWVGRATGLTAGVAGFLIFVSNASAAPGDELFKLTASDAAASDLFGRSVGISGNIAIVGADGDDDAGSGSGSAYLFDATTGNQLLKLTASDAAASDAFGRSVGISGATAVVGAWDLSAPANLGSAYLFDVTTGNELFKLSSESVASDAFGWSVGISGNIAIVGAFQDNVNGSESGAAYLFDATTGNQLLKLTASDAAANAAFGWSVGISGNIAIVGAPGKGPAGSAYLFDVTTGAQLAKLTASDAAAHAFGNSVAIHGDVAIIGDVWDDHAGTYTGSAYLFDVTTGEKLHKLTASDAAAYDEFGMSVAVSDTVAVVGLIGGDGYGPGAAYMFDVNTGNQLFKVTASGGATSDAFGRSVAISGETAIVGDWQDDHAGTSSGAAYLYEAYVGGILDGDANLDGTVNGLDLSILAANWQRTGDSSWATADFNGDMITNGLDLSILAANWLTTSSAGDVAINDALLPTGLGNIPDPASVALLAGGGPLLTRRRRGA